MNTNRIPEVYQNIIYLMACAVHQKDPDACMVSRMDQQELYRAATMHSLSSLVASALEHSDLSDEVREMWKQERMKAIRKEMLFDSERQKIYAFLESRGIWYMPMKGILIKKLYPKYGMRQMSDNDILFDASRHAEVRDYMVAAGYRVESYGKFCNDEYQKEPVLYFEMHRTLFEKEKNQVWYTYYENVKDWLIPEGGESCAWHFTDEDLYVYLLVHGCKHYTTCGTGLRTLLDFYLFLEKKESSMDWDKIHRECKTLGIEKFEEICRVLSRELFSDPEKLSLSEEDLRHLASFSDAGTYGNLEIQIRNQLTNVLGEDKTPTAGDKLRYIGHRLFPSAYYLEDNYPFLVKHPRALPVAWAMRMVHSIPKRKRIQHEVSLLHKEGRK